MSNPVWGGSGSGPAKFHVGHRCQGCSTVQAPPPRAPPASQGKQEMGEGLAGGLAALRLRARFPVLLPSLPPCVVPTSFLLTLVCTCWEHPWFGVRCFSPEHAELTECFVCYLPLPDACLFDQPLSQAPVWILNERVRECASETAGFRGRLQFQLTQTNFSVTFHQRQRSKLMKETWVSYTILKVFFLNTWTHLLNVEIQIHIQICLW